MSAWPRERIVLLRDLAWREKWHFHHALFPENEQEPVQLVRVSSHKPETEEREELLCRVQEVFGGVRCVESCKQNSGNQWEFTITLYLGSGEIPKPAENHKRFHKR